MRKFVRSKPCPKSAKPILNSKKHGTLSETSTDSDDSSLEQSVDNNNSYQAPSSSETRNTLGLQERTNVSEFRTPDLAYNDTDYGLEFTTSNLQNTSPRRCSTIKPTASSQESRGEANAKKSNKENETPLFALAKSSQKSKSPKKLTNQQKAKTKITKTSLPKETPEPKNKQVTRRPRKRHTPLQLEQRFWNEVKALQNRTGHLIPMLPFSRLVRELMQDASTEVTKITPTAMEALQTSSELYIGQRLQDAYMLTLHRGRVTLDVKDMELINYLKTNL